MSAQELHALLSRLHAELQGSPQLDEESRQLLREVGADLARLGERAGPDAGEGTTMAAATGEGHASRLDALVGRFEGAHPSLAASLREMADALARAGL